ncbi:MAG TPA: hypothetical protein PLA88_02345 [Bacteroidales bacterium]|nr:hypothetical protein [Bacteroidales bacterium]
MKALKCIFVVFVSLLCSQCGNNKNIHVTEKNPKEFDSIYSLNILVFNQISAFIETRSTSCPLINVFVYEKADSCFIIIYDSPLFHKANFVGFFLYNNIPVVINCLSNICNQKFILQNKLFHYFPKEHYAVEDNYPPIPNYENNSVVYFLTMDNMLLPTNSLQDEELNRIIFPDLYKLQQQGTPAPSKPNPKHPSQYWQNTEIQ